MNKVYGNGLIFQLKSALTMMALMLVVSSCKTFQKSTTPVVKASHKPEDKTAPDLQQLIYENAFNASSMNGKASVKSVIGNQELSFNINLRLRTDSVIWISISPLLGIEVARVIITQDSVKYLDRLNNKYSVTDFEFLNDLFKVNVDFEIIQGILTGNLFSYKKNKFNSVYLEDSYYILSTLSKRKLKRSLEDQDITKPIVQDMWVDGSSYKITKLSIEDHKSNKSLQTNYSDQRLTDAGLFPFRSTTSIQADKLIKVDIDFSKVNVNNELEFPFSIPPSYEKVN